MTNERGIWTEFYRVHSYEVDAHGYAPIQTLCNFLQETAANHARALGFSAEAMLDRGFAWVLARLHVEMVRYPQWGHTVSVETWHSGVSGLYTTREFVMRDGAGCLIGRATSSWIIIDVERRRIARPPADLCAVDTSERGRILADAFPSKPALPDVSDCERRFPVRASDLDLNQHVSNVRYAEWAIESTPAEVSGTNVLTEIELLFRAESTLGDTVVCRASRTAADDTAPVRSNRLRFMHEVRRNDDDRTLAVARTTWSPASRTETGHSLYASRFHATA